MDLVRAEFARLTACKQAHDDLEWRLRHVESELKERMNAAEVARRTFTHAHPCYMWKRQNEDPQRAAQYRNLVRKRNNAVHVFEPVREFPEESACQDPEEHEHEYSEEGESEGEIGCPEEVGEVYDVMIQSQQAEGECNENEVECQEEWDASVTNGMSGQSEESEKSGEDDESEKSEEAEESEESHESAESESSEESEDIVGSEDDDESEKVSMNERSEGMEEAGKIVKGEEDSQTWDTAPSWLEFLERSPRPPRHECYPFWKSDRRLLRDVFRPLSDLRHWKEWTGGTGDVSLIPPREVHLFCNTLQEWCQIVGDTALQQVAAKIDGMLQEML